MPEISRFYGIIIYMFFNDHNPPHFKAVYGEYEVNVKIEDGLILDGSMPNNKLKLVVAWCEIHKDELMEMWASKQFYKLNPLI